ncbi:MAG: hypothetical protein K1Y02_23070, partial [Candidatus Hydrogenedentes bacterium]|nr:hypothetical protein [Candidatus Hydrogenedentota bacterium]
MATVTQPHEPTPKRVGVVNAILGHWLHGTNPFLTPEEITRAKYHCRQKLAEARVRHGGRPPVDVLLCIDETVALHLLAFRETMQMLRRTNPLLADDEPQQELQVLPGDPPTGAPGTPDRGKTKPPKTAPARARTSEGEPLFKADR